MSLSPQLLEILVCPKCKGTLEYHEAEGVLVCPVCRLRYAVRDDIPIMLIDEAEAVDDAEHDRLMSKAEAEGIKPTFEA
jgi:uncharacterized protein